MEERVRDILARLEADLLEKINFLRSELAPLEGELADIRRARAALPEEKERVVSLKATIGSSSEVRASLAESPYQSLTMKELTLKALKEQFPNGATVNELISFFRDAWGREDIIRSSLSPQLSRLKNDNKIDRKGLTWFLVNETPGSDEPGAPDHHDDGDGTSSSSGNEASPHLLLAPPGASPAHPGE